MSHQYTVSRFHWIDTGMHTASPLEPLAIDEALVHHMGSPNAVPAVHLWVYDRALFLGRRDAKLPRLAYALKRVGQKGYGAVLRASGGAAVPLDRGVLNAAIVLPDTHISIQDFFQYAAGVIGKGLGVFGPVSFGEVTGSYCVGEYDFAIGGKKMGGMAQRRTRHGAILQLCIHVEGTGLERGQLMEQFYTDAGLSMMAEQKPIPAMRSDTIGTIADVTGGAVTMEEVKHSLFRAFSTMADVVPLHLFLSTREVESAKHHLTEKLGLFAHTAADIAAPDWHLP